MLGDVRQPGLSLTSEFFNHISNILICQLLNIFLDLLKNPHRFSGYFQNLKSFFTDARWQLSTPLHENSLHGNFQTRHFRFDDCDYDDDQFESCYFLFVQKMRINIFFNDYVLTLVGLGLLQNLFNSLGMCIVGGFDHLYINIKLLALGIIYDHQYLMLM